MDEKIKLIVDSFGKDRMKLNEPLRYHTALASSGLAKLFIITFTTAEIIKIVKMSRQLKVPLFIFGTGSKIMISDQGFDGVVIKNRTSGVVIKGIKGKVSKMGLGVDEALVEAVSGTSINKLVEFLKNQNLIWQDLEGIVGTIGGNLFLNVDLQKRVKSIKVLDEYSDIEEIGAEQLNFKKQIILSVVFKFKSLN